MQASRRTDKKIRPGEGTIHPFQQCCVRRDPDAKSSVFLSQKNFESNRKATAMTVMDLYPDRSV
jgi:hypothetical protein